MFARALKSDEWQRYRDLRFEALAAHEDVYGSCLAIEKAWGDDVWIDLFSDQRHQFFGLFDRENLIGSGAVFTDRNDKAGKTALLASAYIQPDYRGQGLSRLLYEARIRWIVESDRFDRIAVGHKQGNEASRRANQHFGFIKTGTEEIMWGDGSTDIKHTYELRLR